MLAHCADMCLVFEDVWILIGIIVIFYELDIQISACILLRNAIITVLYNCYVQRNNLLDRVLRAQPMDCAASFFHMLLSTVRMVILFPVLLCF